MSCSVTWCLPRPISTLKHSENWPWRSRRYQITSRYMLRRAIRPYGPPKSFMRIQERELRPSSLCQASIPSTPQRLAPTGLLILVSAITGRLSPISPHNALWSSDLRAPLRRSKDERAVSSEREFDLGFEAAVIGGLVEALAVLAAGDLVGGAEVGRRDVATVQAASGRGLGGPIGTPTTSHRFNLSIGLSIRNLLNHTNPGPIVGNITSPYFGSA